MAPSSGGILGDWFDWATSTSEVPSSEDRSSDGEKEGHSRGISQSRRGTSRLHPPYGERIIPNALNFSALEADRIAHRREKAEASRMTSALSAATIRKQYQVQTREALEEALAVGREDREKAETTDDDSSDDSLDSPSCDDDSSSDKETDNEKRGMSEKFENIIIRASAKDQAPDPRSDKFKHQLDKASGNHRKASPSASDFDESDFFQGGAGALLVNKYRVVSELGVGTFGRVMKCYRTDTGSWKEKVGLGKYRGKLRQKTSGVFAVKIMRNQPKYRRDAQIEAKMLRVINSEEGKGTNLFPDLYDEFDLPEGHKCLVLERLGMSLYDVMKKNDHEPFSNSSIRDVAAQVFDALDHMHSLGMVHTDIKPENILLAENNDDARDTRVKIIDLGSADYEKDANKDNICNTRQYRAPEIILSIGWSYPSDIWAAGCTIAELYLGELLFPAKNDVEHLALMEKSLGLFPQRMLLTAIANKGSDGAKCFDPVIGTHRMKDVLEVDSIAFVDKRKTLRDQVAQGTRQQGDEGIYYLLRSVLSIDPMQRISAQEGSKLAMDIDCRQ